MENGLSLSVCKPIDIEVLAHRKQHPACVCFEIEEPFQNKATIIFDKLPCNLYCVDRNMFIVHLGIYGLFLYRLMKKRG